MTIKQAIIVAFLLFYQPGMAQNEGGQQTVKWSIGGALVVKEVDMVVTVMEVEDTMGK